jgi:hypothetical protein
MQIVLTGDNCRIRASCTGTGVGDILKERQTKHKIQCSDVMFHAMPLSVLIRRRRFQILLIAIGLGGISSVLWSVFNSGSYGVFQVSTLKIIGLEENELPAWISIYHAGCSKLNNLSLISNELSLPHIVDMSGFSLRITHPDRELSKWTHFTLFGSKDNGSSWFLVGASDFRTARAAPRFLDRAFQLDPATEFYADYRASVLWFISCLAQSLVLGIGFLASGLCGTFFRAALGVRTFCISLAVSTALALAASVSELAHGDMRGAFLPGTRALAFIGAAAVLHIAEPFCAELLVTFGSFCLTARVIDDCLIYHDSAYLLADPPVAELSAVAMGAMLLILRLRFCTSAKQAALHVQGQPLPRPSDAGPGRRALDDVRVIADQLRHACSELPVRHGLARVEAFTATPRSSQSRRRKRRSSIWDRPERAYETLVVVAPPRDSVGSESSAQESHSSSVACIDQLYSQAVGLAPALSGICAAWAAQSRGQVLRAATLAPCDSGGSAVGDGLCTHTAVLRGVLTGEIKSPIRAVRKALACYGGDVSRVVDICRARIGFDDPAGLLACLEMIRGDAQRIVLCSVKDLLTTSSSPTFPVPLRRVTTPSSF